MTDSEHRQLVAQKWYEQDGYCGTCGLPLAPWVERCRKLGLGDGLELAHRIPRGKVVRKLGKAYEWHPKVLMLVCTRYGKRCNDGALIGAAHPLEEQALLDEIRGESVEQGMSRHQPLGA